MIQFYVITIKQSFLTAFSIIQLIMLLRKPPIKFPLSLKNYQQIDSHDSLLQLFQNDLQQLGLTINQNPFMILRKNQLIPQSENKYLRAICAKGDKCHAKLIYQYNQQTNLYELTSFAVNQHSHEIYRMNDLLKLQKKNEILTKRHHRNRKDMYRVGVLFQTDKMKKRYRKFGKCLYINTVQIKQYTVIYFTGQNYMTDIVIFALCIVEICSKDTFRQILKEFKENNPGEPETIISVNQEILEEVKDLYKSVMIYCFDNILPTNMKIREGVIKLLKQAFSPNQWEIQLRKVLMFVRNARQSPYLKYIYENYQKLALFRLPPTFVSLGVFVNLGELLTQHTQEYWHRHRTQLEQQQTLIRQTNARKALTKLPIPEIQDIDRQHKDLFVRLMPKIIQTTLQDIQPKQVLSKLQSIEVANRTISNPNEITHSLYEEYSPYAIDFLIDQRNRSMFCDIFQEGNDCFIVKQANEENHQLVKKDIESLDQNEQVQKQTKWQCSCMLEKKTGMPCSHLLKLLISQKQKAGKLSEYICDFWVLDKVEEQEQQKAQNPQKIEKIKDSKQIKMLSE